MVFAAEDEERGGRVALGGEMLRVDLLFVVVVVAVAVVWLLSYEGE